MKNLYVLIIFASVYLGLVVLSSSLKNSHKILCNLVLSLPTVFLFNIVGGYMGITVDVNLFTLVVTALCSPAGIIVLLVTRLMGA